MIVGDLPRMMKRQTANAMHARRKAAPGSPVVRTDHGSRIQRSRAGELEVRLPTAPTVAAVCLRIDGVFGNDVDRLAAVIRSDAGDEDARAPGIGVETARKGELDAGSHRCQGAGRSLARRIRSRASISRYPRRGGAVLRGVLLARSGRIHLEHQDPRRRSGNLGDARGESRRGVAVELANRWRADDGRWRGRSLATV